MKFSISKRNFELALKSVCDVIDHNSKIPITRSVLLESSNGVLRLTATDLDHTVVKTVSVIGKENGTIAVPAKKLLDLISSMPETEITFSASSEKKLTVSFDKGKFNVSGESASEFPVTKSIASTTEFEYDAATLVNRLSGVKFAMSSDEALRSTLCGVFLEVRSDRFCMVATDGHRLAKIVDSVFVSESPCSAILPAKAVMFLLKNIKGEDKVKIGLSNESSVFKYGDTTFITKVVAGIYPKYERVIPAANQFEINGIEVSEWLSAVRRAKIFADETTSRVMLSIRGKELTFDAQQQIGDHSSEKVSAQYDATTESLQIGCNAGYFIELLQSIGAERIKMRFNDPGSAITFEPEEQAQDEHRLMLLMPIRLEQ